MYLSKEKKEEIFAEHGASKATLVLQKGKLPYSLTALTTFQIT